MILFYFFIFLFFSIYIYGKKQTEFVKEKKQTNKQTKLKGKRRKPDK